MRIEPTSRAGRAWSPEQDDQLKSLVLNNVPFRQAVATINAEHGTNFSRSAAIGRANRLGLCKSVPKAERAVQKAVKTERILEARRKRAATKPVSEPKFKATPIEKNQPYAGRLDIALTDLFDLSGERPNQCRAIEGDALDALYCGVATRPGLSWCDHHHARFCQKPDPRLKSVNSNRSGRKVSNYIGSYEAA